MRKLYFVLASDEKYIKPTSVSIMSVIFNSSKQFKCEFFVFAYDYKYKPKEFINLELKYSCKINVIFTNKYNSIFKNQSPEKFLNNWISFATYHRLLMFKILPKYVDYAVYLDCDVIVNEDISKLILNFDNTKLLAAVVEVGTIIYKETVYKYLEEIVDFKKFNSNPLKYPYFNAGFYIANIKLSKKMNVFDDILDFLKRYNPKLADQDTLNAVFSQKHSNLMLYLEPRYNVFCEAEYDKLMPKDIFYHKNDVINAMNNPAVIHYAGGNKPWINENYLHFHNVWDKYAALADIYIKKHHNIRFKIFPRNSYRRRLIKPIYKFGKKIKKTLRYNEKNSFYFKRFMQNGSIFSKLFNFCFNVVMFVAKKINKCFKNFGSNFRIKHSGFKTNIDQNYNPYISVIVPNYNHGKYLRKRLNSIYRQTYKNYEVILLDDNSSDNSLKILNRFCKKHKNTKIIINKINSGCAFMQWIKGISYAKYDLIWIAESDDWCDKHFLENLKDGFKDDKVTIASGSCVAKLGYKTYYNQLTYNDDVKRDWRSIFTSTSESIVADGLAWKNVIPNASQIIFKKKDYKIIIDKYKLFEMKLSGDWLFYLHNLYSGKFYYNVNALNFHRLHKNNLSLIYTKSENWCKEMIDIFKYVKDRYKLTNKILGYWKYNYSMGAYSIYGNNFKSILQGSEIFNNDSLKIKGEALFVFNSFADTSYNANLLNKANSLVEQNYCVVFYNLNLDEDSNSNLFIKLNTQFAIFNECNCSLNTLLMLFNFKEVIS